MHFAPRHRLHSYINDIRTILANLKDRSHRQSRPTMTMILNQYIRMFLLDSPDQLPQHTRATDTCHVFQTNFRCTGLNQLIGNSGIILNGMHRRIRDTKSCLRNHTCFQSIFNRRNDISRFVQSTENTCDVDSLRMLDFIHQFTHICRNRIHAQRIQSAIEHMRLNTRFFKRCGKSTDGFIRIFAVQQIHLLKSTAIRFNSGKTAHLNNQRSVTNKLINPRLIFTGRLPHVPINKTEFNFLFHHSQ